MHRQVGLVTVTLLLLACGLAHSNPAAPGYTWALTDPNGEQLASFRVGDGVISVASVHLINGCQTPFFVPEETPFVYDLKIRTNTTEMCTQAIRDQIVEFYDASPTDIVHVKTESGVVTVPVEAATAQAPLP